MIAINPTVTTKVLSALDNESSLWPLLVKDLIDNTGRSVMEYRRGGEGATHAGRERAFEEYTTTAVWIGGRKLLNKMLLDPLMQHFGLDPKVDIMLFLKNHGQDIPKWIDKNRQRYLVANIARFAVGTLVPVAVIGWVIPSVNQAITRHRVAQEQMRKHKADLLLVGQPLSHKTGVRTYPMMAGNNPFSTAPVRFGGSSAALEKMAGLINNDFWGNVAIDAGISGGRLYKARNWVDFMETAIRESSIVAFLYFLGDYVKGHLRRHFDKSHGTVTDLSYDAIKWLKHQKITSQQWKAEMKLLEGLNGNNGYKTIAALLNPLTGKFEKNPILELARLQGKIHILSADEHLPLGAFRNIFGDAVKHSHQKFILDPRRLLNIPDLKEALVGYTEHSGPFASLARKIAGLFGKKLKPGSFATQKAGAVTQLLKMAKPGKFQASITHCLEKTGKYKMAAMLSSYAISTVCIAYLTPMFQHWLTYTLTGKVDFPGTRKDVPAIK